MTSQPVPAEKTHWLVSMPFLLAHVLAVALAIYVGATWQLVLAAVISYYVRMFFVTAGYHRYFAHRSYQLNRFWTFVWAFMAQTTAQKGALWWASHHRHHHRASDQADDVHSPLQRGFWWSHVGWILSSKYEETNYAGIKDFARFPELVFLNKHHWIPAAVGLAALYFFGGLPLLVWAGLVATVFLWHGTFTINSLSHVFGKRRYLTTDTSRNNWLLAILTCGEGWHNNHHYHQNTANQGWFWWEVDFSFYALKVLSWVGIVKGLRLPSEATKLAHLKYTEAQRAQLKRESLPGFQAGQGDLKPPAPTPTPDQPIPAVPLPAQV